MARTHSTGFECALWRSRRRSKNIKRRLVVLTADGVLSYYDEELNAKGGFALGDGQWGVSSDFVVRASSSTEAEPWLEFESEQQILKLCPFSEGDHTAWRAALERHCRVTHGHNLSSRDEAQVPMAPSSPAPSRRVGRWSRACAGRRGSRPLA